jgi:hypothetical protein
MAEYRLYCLDETGRISTAHDMEAPSDEDAIREARAMKIEVKCELWEHERLVAVLEPHSAR